MKKPHVQLVWFKRDLRIVDHRPLTEAAVRGPVLPLYVAEPDLWRQADSAGRHWAMIREGLTELRRELAGLGQPLVVRVGEWPQVLESLADSVVVETVWSHEETGNAWTYERDGRVGRRLRELGIPWHEIPQNGVIRGLVSRDGWSRQWEARMSEPVADAPAALTPLPNLDVGTLPEAADLGLAPDPCRERQTGGRRAALGALDSFLASRGVAYSREMSSPVTAYRSCSRLSPHLAYGTLSMREVVQRTRHRRREVKALDRERRGTWAKSLSAFEGRLHWHCHFMQKLESEPRMEFENLHRAADGLRETEFEQTRFEAWCLGETGLPFVDACQRALGDTGWINFRMRAMLASFAAYHLWLHWRQPSLFLARQFSDYEPGIHYSQIQMQSGTTGINTFRIYNPVKQSRDQDPDGLFIRRWVPELAGVPVDYLHEPWLMGADLQRRYGCRLGGDYPEPLVDHAFEARRARARLRQLRAGGARVEAQRILERHGSRRGSRARS